MCLLDKRFDCAYVICGRRTGMAGDISFECKVTLNIFLCSVLFQLLCVNAGVVVEV
jgi:hypothetical protein